MVGRKPRFEPKVGKVIVENVNDAQVEDQLMRLILLALEIADRTPEEATEIQRRSFDNG